MELNTKMLQRKSLIDRFNSMGEELIPGWNPQLWLTYRSGQPKSLLEYNEGWFEIVKFFHIKLFRHLGMSEEHEEFKRLDSIDINARPNCILCFEKVVGTTDTTERVSLNFKNFFNHYTSHGHFRKLMESATVKSTNNSNWTPISPEKLTPLNVFQEKLLSSIKVHGHDPHTTRTTLHDPVKYHINVVEPRIRKEKVLTKEALRIASRGGFLDEKKADAVNKACKLGPYASGGSGFKNQQYSYFSGPNQPSKDQLEADKMYFQNKTGVPKQVYTEEQVYRMINQMKLPNDAPLSPIPYHPEHDNMVLYTEEQVYRMINQMKLPNDAPLSPIP